MTAYPSRKKMIAEYDAYYTENREKWAVPARNEFAARICLMLRPKTIVDIGCGNGHTLKYFAGIFPKAKLYGVDISPVACEIASESGADITCAFLDKYVPPVSRFDLALCLGVAEHFEKPAESLAVIRGMARYLYLECPDNLAYDPGEEGYRRLAVGSHQLEWHWTRKTWESVINQAGWKIRRAAVGKKPSWRFAWLLG